MKHSFQILSKTKNLILVIFENKKRDERLLTDCLKDLNKSQQRQLKSLIFELQNLKLKEKEFEGSCKQKHIEVEKQMEKLNEKRDHKLSELNLAREKVLKNKNMSELKTKMLQLNTAEIDLEEKMKETQTELAEETEELDRLVTQLNIKKMYSASEDQSLSDLIEAENLTIHRAREQIESVKTQKEKNYELIEAEFERARLQMIAQLENRNQEFLKWRLERKELAEKEFKLRKFLDDGLYENEEEKCLVENELSELTEPIIKLNSQIEQTSAMHKKYVDDQMSSEYQALEELKNQDSHEIRQDEEQIGLLYETSIKNIKNLVEIKKTNVLDRQHKLKCLQTTADLQSKKMNELLIEV